MNIKKALSKFISLMLCAVLIAQTQVPLFAETASNPYGASSKDLDNLDRSLSSAYDSADNPYEAALNEQVKNAIEKLKKNINAKQIDSARKQNASLGIMLPAYINVSKTKQLKALHKDLQNFISSYFAEQRVMTFDKFKVEYEKYVKQTAANFYKEGKTKGYESLKDPVAQLAQDLKNKYPAKQEYEEYKAEAQKEIAWRKANNAKIEEGGYKVIRAYIKAIGPMNLNAEFSAFLLNTELNGKKLISQQERKQIFEYNITHIEKQDLSDTKAKINEAVIGIILERIIISGYVSNENNARYAKALKDLLYRSEEGIGFPYILNTVFSALISTGNFTTGDTILAKYHYGENEGEPWWTWITKLKIISPTEYNNLYRNSDGYLGQYSHKAQYTTNYAYKNAFEDIAIMLSKDNTQPSLNILRKYGENKTVKNSIKPFMAAAIISPNGFKDKTKRINYAVELANLSLKDITATQEYDLDRTLAGQLPSIQNRLNNNAITTKQKYEQNTDFKKNLDFIQRVAVSADVALAVWGTVGLVKISVKTIGLGRATYTAIKAGRLSSGTRRIAYIRANYAKMSSYISAKRSLMRFRNKITLKLGGTVDIREMRKLQSDLDAKHITTLNKRAQKSSQAVTQSTSPTAREVARADLDQARLNAYQAQTDYRLNYRLYGEGYNTKATSYLDKVRNYRGVGPAPVAPQFTAGELAFQESFNTYNSSLSALNTATRNYKDLGFFNKHFFNPVKNFWNKPYIPTINDLPITAMETGKGTTIAEAFGLNTTYTPPATDGLRFFTSNKTNWAYKTYDWLDRHNMPWLSKGLKFVNNKATVLGTTLLFNYNLATVNPASLTAMERVVPATELVMSSPNAISSAFAPLRTANSLKPVKINLNPVSAVDPKMLQAYKTIPLPGGNVFNGHLLNFTFVKAQDLAATVYGTLKTYAEESKPFSLFAGQAGGFVASYNPAIAKNLIFPLVLTGGNVAAATQSDIPLKEPAIPVVEQKVNKKADLFTDKLADGLLKDFTNRTTQAGALGNIKIIENAALSNADANIINNVEYSSRQLQLLQIAPYITTPSFIYLSQLLTGDYAQGKNKLDEIAILASKNDRSKKDNAKLDENIQYYASAIRLFDSYIDLITGTQKAKDQKVYFVIDPVSPKKFQQGQAPSVKDMDTKAFALAVAANFFETTRFKAEFKNFVDNASEEKVASLLPVLMQANIDINNFDQSHPGYDKKGVKGCFINTKSQEWGNIGDNLTAEQIGISVETQIKDISQVIAEWMHKNNIPLAYKGTIQPQEVFDNLIAWAEDMIGVKPGQAHTYVNDEGELHVYNKDYTKRIRYGKHESKPGDPHIHIESITNGSWYGIDNKAYYFESLVPAYSNLIIKSLNDLKTYFISQPYVNIMPENNEGSPKKILYILGGPNASGKSHFYNKFFAKSGLPFLNQDIIAEQNNMSPREAGYETLRMIDDMFKRDKSFIYESTLSGRNVISMINTAHEKDYRVVIIYTFVKDAKTSIERAKKRVEEGGHSVPFESLEGRYYKSRDNFWNIYRDIADDWIMYLNDDNAIIPLAAKTQNIRQIEIFDKDAFSTILLKPQDLQFALPPERAESK